MTTFLPSLSWHPILYYPKLKILAEDRWNHRLVSSARRCALVFRSAIPALQYIIIEKVVYARLLFLALFLGNRNKREIEVCDLASAVPGTKL
jgi:hypothetical protein